MIWSGLMWSGLIWCVWYVIDWTGIVGYDMVWSDVVWSGLLREQQAQVCLQPLTHIFREMSVLILPIIRVFNPALLQVEALYCIVGPFECVFWLAVGLMWAVQTWHLLLWYFNTSLLKTHHDPCMCVCVSSHRPHTGVPRCAGQSVSYTQTTPHVT